MEEGRRGCALAVADYFVEVEATAEPVLDFNGIEYLIQSNLLRRN